MTAPLVYNYVELGESEVGREFREKLRRKFQEQGDIEFAKEQLMRSSGIEVADKLSIEHINLSLESLLKVENPRAKDGKNR